MGEGVEKDDFFGVCTFPAARDGAAAKARVMCIIMRIGAKILGLLGNLRGR